MKRDFLLRTFIWLSLCCSNNSLFAQTDLLDEPPSDSSITSSESSELTDGPQTLPADEATPEKLPEQTTEAIKVEELPLALEEPTLQSKTGVISEENLFKTKTKKRSSKIKTEKISESEMYVQEADKYKLNDSFKNLQLNDVIEQGLRQNYDQNLRFQRQEIRSINYAGAKSAFWLPEVKILLTTDDQKIATLKSSSRPLGTRHSTSPSGTLGLVLGDYTVFNWGKDYALYLNVKETYERSRQILDESKRELKLSLIDNYFTLVAFKNVVKFRQDQLRQASFVYRLSKEKITIGKTSKQDYYQARSEYLKAQNDYHESKIVADRSDENVALLITDPIGTKYVINETLDYRRIKMTLDEALSFAEKLNPSLLTDRTVINNAGRSYDVALKENMPLPRFSINLGAYDMRFGQGINSTRYETYSGSGEIELVAAINATWSLTGTDGLFNSNKLASSRLNREIAIKELERDTHGTRSFVRQTYKTILSLQNQIVILEARVPGQKKTFDAVLENYLAGKARFYEFSLALADLTNTKIFYEQIKLLHLKEKLNLAKFSGLEDFPGENFEHLASRVKGK